MWRRKSLLRALTEPFVPKPTGSIPWLVEVLTCRVTGPLLRAQTD